MHYLVRMKEHRKSIKSSPTFTLILHCIRLKLCPLTPTGSPNPQYDPQCCDLTVFANLLNHLREMNEPSLAGYIALNSYPINDERDVPSFVRNLSNHKRLKYILRRSIPHILSALPTSSTQRSDKERRNILTSLFGSSEFTNLALGVGGRTKGYVSSYTHLIPEYVPVSEGLGEHFKTGAINREYKNRLLPSTGTDELPNPDVGGGKDTPKDIVELICSHVEREGFDVEEGLLWLHVTTTYLRDRNEADGGFVKEVVGDGRFQDVAVPVILKQTENLELIPKVEVRRKVRERLEGCKGYSEVLREAVERMERRDGRGDCEGEEEDVGEGDSYGIWSEMLEAIDETEQGMNLATELLNIYERRRSDFTLSDYTFLFKSLHEGAYVNKVDENYRKLRRSGLFKMAVKDVIGGWRNSGRTFSLATTRDYAECMLLLHRMNIKPKIHVLKHFVSKVKSQKYDYKAIETFFLTDFLNHPSMYQRIKLLREVGKRKNKHVVQGRSKSSFSQHYGLLRMISEFTNHPGDEVRRDMLFLWNKFVSLINSGKIDYKNGASKDKIALLYEIDTLARMDKYIEISEDMPQVRMMQMEDDDRRFCQQIAEERQAEKLKFSMHARDKMDTLGEISELLTELNFENELDVPICADGFTHGGGNMEPVTQGSSFNIDIAHITGWQRIAICYVNDFRHDYVLVKGRGRDEGIGGGYDEDRDNYDSFSSIDSMFQAHFTSTEASEEDWDAYDENSSDDFFDEVGEEAAALPTGLCAPNLVGTMVPLEMRQNVEVILESGQPFFAMIESLDEEEGTARVKYIDGSSEDRVSVRRIKVLGGSSKGVSDKNEYHMSQMGCSVIRKLTVWQSLGWNVVLIPSEEWSDLQDRRRKQQYLISKLREVGMDVDGGIVKGVLSTIFGGPKKRDE